MENVFFLADERKIPIGEVLEMPNLEFTAWLVYLARKAQLVQVRG